MQIKIAFSCAENDRIGQHGVIEIEMLKKLVKFSSLKIFLRVPVEFLSLIQKARVLELRVSSAYNMMVVLKEKKPAYLSS